jgi:hypothetical protein
MGYTNSPIGYANPDTVMANKSPTVANPRGVSVGSPATRRFQGWHAA